MGTSRKQREWYEKFQIAKAIKKAAKKCVKK